MKKQLRSIANIFFIVILISIVISIFSYLLKFSIALDMSLPLFTLYLSLPVLIITDRLYRKDHSNISNEINKLTRGQARSVKIPFAHTYLIAISTLLSHLVGVSIGREGVAVQIGATISSNVKQSYYNALINKEVMIIIGIATAFSTFFGTPITASIFAYEYTKQVKKINTVKFLPVVLISSFTGYLISNVLRINHLHINIKNIEYNIENFLAISVLLLLLLFFSYAYINIFRFLKNMLNNIRKRNIEIRLLLTSIICTFMIFFNLESMRGLGTTLIDIAINNHQQVSLLMPVIKMLLTISFVTIGFKGGEVTPIFAIGACLGAFIARIYNVDHLLLVTIGIAVFFSLTTNSKLSGIFLMLELSNLTILPLAFIITVILLKLAPKKGVYEI